MVIVSSSPPPSLPYMLPGQTRRLGSTQGWMQRFVPADSDPIERKGVKRIYFAGVTVVSLHSKAFHIKPERRAQINKAERRSLLHLSETPSK